MTSTPQLPDIAIRLLEVVAAGRPEAAAPQPLKDHEWTLFPTQVGPVVLRTFPDQDNIKVRIPTRSDAGLRLALGAEYRRNADLRVQSSFNSREWIIDVRPDDDYDYLRAIGEVLWIR
jgi:hypothetical protein